MTGRTAAKKPFGFDYLGIQLEGGGDSSERQRG